jgi:hypothetical protein
MTLEEIRNIISIFINNNKPNLSVGVDRLNVLLKMANIDYFKQWTGLPEQWQPGQPISSRGWQVSSINTEALTPFVVYVHDQVIDVNGRVNYPADFVQFSDCGYYYDSTYYVPVEPILHSELYERESSSITPPTTRYPICLNYGTYLQFYPIDLLNVDLTYLRLPTTPIYALKQENGIDVYDSASSTQFEWDERYHSDLIRMILGYLGIPIKDINLLNYIETKKKEGV